MPKRGKGFTKGEVDHLLEIVEDIIPIGPSSWERVLERHVLLYPNLDRTKDSLRKKFASLYNNKTPTGDPKCPANVRKAKHIYRLIQDKMELTDGDGSDEDYEEDEDGEEEDDNDEEERQEEVQDRSNNHGEAAAQPTLNLAAFTFSDEEEVGEVQVVASDRVEVGKEKAPATTTVAKKTVRRASSFSTPVVKKRRGDTKNEESKEEDSFNNVMKYMMMQRQMEIDAENRRRDRDDRIREERREADERRRELEEIRLEARRVEEDRRERRREEEQQRHNQMMEMFMMHMMSGNINRSGALRNDNMEEQNKQSEDRTEQKDEN